MPKVPKAPKTLVEALVPQQPAQRKVQREPIRLSFVSNSYVQAALEGELQRVVYSLPGTRNHNLFVASANLGSLFAAGIIPDARRQLQAAAEHCGLVKDDGVQAARATIESGWKRGCANPRELRGNNGG